MWKSAHIFTKPLLRKGLQLPKMEFDEFGMDDEFPGGGGFDDEFDGGFGGRDSGGGIDDGMDEGGFDPIDDMGDIDGMPMDNLGDPAEDGDFGGLDNMNAGGFPEVDSLVQNKPGTWDNAPPTMPMSMTGGGATYRKRTAASPIQVPFRSVHSSLPKSSSPC